MSPFLADNAAGKRLKLEPSNGEEAVEIKEEEITIGAGKADGHSSRNYRGYRTATPSHPGYLLNSV